MTYRLLHKYTSIFLLAGFLFPAFLCASDDIPAIKKFVEDHTGLFSRAEVASLSDKAGKFAAQTSTQVVVYVTNDLKDYDISEFAFELGEKNGVGGKQDNGIVIVLKPKKGNSKGQVFIATGYGLEGIIPDAVAKRIVEREFIPNFKKGNYYAGISQGMDVLFSLASKEFPPQEYLKKSKKKNLFGRIVIFFFLFCIFFAIVGGMLKTVSATRKHARINGLSFWAAWALMNAASSKNSHSGMFSDFSSGRGSFGGGGGFGGFSGGGGSFGGGGAGGSW